MSRKTPIPRAFHTHAAAFSAAAEVVSSSKLKDPLPEYFLWARTIELVLKSFLVAEGMTLSEVRSRKFGHDLNSLLREARQRGISELIGRDAIQTGLVQLLNHDYLSKRFEYREPGTRYHLPDVGMTRQLVGRLLRGVDFHLRTKLGIGK